MYVSSYCCTSVLVLLYICAHLVYRCGRRQYSANMPDNSGRYYATCKETGLVRIVQVQTKPLCPVYLYLAKPLC